MSDHPDHRADAWRPPAVIEAIDAIDAIGDDIPGALGGSRLFEQPRYRAEVDRFLAFITPPTDGPGQLAVPIAVEIGFDHGRRLLSLAQADATTRWIGLEVRRARVDALAAIAPPNLLPWRADARTVFRRLMPPARLSRVDIWFPTPWWHDEKRAKRLLLAPPFLADVARALAPGGLLCVATDVTPYFDHLSSLLARWRPAPMPPPAPMYSRREVTCHRQGIAVHRGAWTAPEMP